MDQLPSSRSYIGTTVTILTASGVSFTGLFLGIRHHDDDCFQGGQFVFLRLTVASPPYVIGEVIAINLAQIVSIGPIFLP
ncbi:MAG TPA: hypothetical protein PKA10_18185 [Selenomonadales bacterium]|nr:hypothetical protein [Selenomonadales bacterium]